MKNEQGIIYLNKRCCLTLALPVLSDDKWNGCVRPRGGDSQEATASSFCCKFKEYFAGEWSCLFPPPPLLRSVGCWAAVCWFTPWSSYTVLLLLSRWTGKQVRCKTWWFWIDKAHLFFTLQCLKNVVNYLRLGQLQYGWNYFVFSFYLKVQL